MPGPVISTGAHDRNRTDDLVLTKDALYRLSYTGCDLSASEGQTKTYTILPKKEEIVNSEFFARDFPLPDRLAPFPR